MAPIVHTAPLTFQALQTPDGRYYWRINDTATAYTALYTCQAGATFHDIAKDHIVVIDRVVIDHTTTAANERSTFSTAGSFGGLSKVLESGDTNDTYHVYGPAYSFPALESGYTGQAIIVVADKFAEWSGNCTTGVDMHGRFLPRLNLTDQTPPVYSTPVDVKKIDVWPWSR